MSHAKQPSCIRLMWRYVFPNCKGLWQEISVQMVAHLRVHINPSEAPLPWLVIEIRLIRGGRKELWNKIIAQSDQVVSLSSILSNFLEDYFSELRTFVPLFALCALRFFSFHP